MTTRPLQRLSSTVLLGIACIVSAASADVTLPRILSSGVVLQRDQPIAIWGTAAPSENVLVEFAGSRAEVAAGPNGRWRVELPSQPAGGPFSLVVRGRNHLEVTDVMVGEVWVASGQSNMEMPVGQTAGAEEETALPINPRVRVFKVKKAQAGTPQTDVEGQWRSAAPETRGDFTAAGYYFAKEISAALDVPVGIVDSTWGGSSAAAWTPLSDLSQDLQLCGYLARYVQASTDLPKLQPIYERNLAEWTKATGPNPTFEQTLSRPPRPMGPGHPSVPAAMFNAMIAPLSPLRIRGVIWYQGETDVDRAVTYRKLFPTLISAWRRQWETPLLPFLFVQLPGYNSRKDRPKGSPWAEMRDAQAATLALPATGMAVALDIGDRNDIHPRNKREVGRRLALQALARTYEKNLVASGPIFAGYEISRNEIHVRFTHASGMGGRAGGQVMGFALAGENRVFYAADALVEGDTVILTSAQVPRPVAARYGWSDDPDATLVNSAGLPAAPFRTDSWPLVTAANP